MNLRQETTREKLNAFLEDQTSSEESDAASISEYLNTIEKPISESIEFLASDAALESMKSILTGQNGTARGGT